MTNLLQGKPAEADGSSQVSRQQKLLDAMLNRLLDRLLELRRLKEGVSVEALEKARNQLLVASVFGLLVTLFGYAPTNAEVGLPYTLPDLPKLWLYAFVGLGILYFTYSFMIIRFGRDVRNYAYYLEEIELVWPAIDSMIKKFQDYGISITIAEEAHRLREGLSERNLFEVYKRVLMHEPLRVGGFRGILFGISDVIPVILGLSSSVVCFWFAYKAIS